MISVCCAAGGDRVIIIRAELQAQQDIGLGKSHSVLNTVKEEKVLGKFLTYSDGFFYSNQKNKIKTQSWCVFQAIKQDRLYFPLCKTHS